MSDQEFTDRREDGAAPEGDALTLDPSFSFEPVADGGSDALPPEPEAVAETAPAGRVLEPSVSSGAPTENADAPAEEEPAPVDADSPAAPSADDPSETMWAAVRDRGRVLTGEEVELPGETTAADDIVGEPSPVDTGQIESVTLGPHTTTIPVMTGEVPVVADAYADPTPTPRDVLAHRSDAEPSAAPAEPAVEETTLLPNDLEETTVQRRSFLAAPAPEAEPELEASWKPREEPVDRAFVPATPRSLDDALFEGATLMAEVPSRTGAHWGSLIGHLLLVPVAWFLLADAGARLTLADGSAMTTGVFSPLGVGELLIGILVLLVLLLLARKSSLGPWFSGVLTAIAGLPWLVVPGLTANTVLPYLRWLDGWNAFGANLSHHLQASGYSGRLLLLGLALIGVGILSHSVRRIGRKEEALRAEVEKVNPVGAHFTARARRKAEKAAGLR